MNTLERGFPPSPRLVHRFASISPHRQVQLLCLISVVIVVVMVTAVLYSLGPTQQSLTVSNDGLIPATERIDGARAGYNAAASALPLTVDPDPNVRAQGISGLTAGNSSGEAAYRAYLRRDADLPGEHALQRSFATHRQQALDAGVLFLSQPLPTAEGLANVAEFSSALRMDLNQLKALYEVRVRNSLRAAGDQVDSTQRQIIYISAGALLLLLLTFGVATRSARGREEQVAALDRALHDDAERNELEARLQRSLEMAHTEPAAYDLVGRALAITVPNLAAELLVADSSRAHFRQATTSGDAGCPGCPVTSPTECPAATWGQTQVWPSSAALDACPYLLDRPAGACSAVCVPVSIGGNTVGVVHTTAPDGHPPDDQAVAKVELIARKVGERVGMLRAFLRSETQAHTDPLTGLMNRRSVEARVRDLSEQSHSYVAAYGDLDHFKQLNDLHGHDAGDQALRLFARVLRETVRPGDLTARYGGEEFVVVLPDCSEFADAYAVVDRIRERLALAQIAASGPRFTVSFGIARSLPEMTFSETLETADAALLDAKSKGRDQVIVAGGTKETPADRSAGVQSTGINSEPVSNEEPTISSTRS